VVSCYCNYIARTPATQHNFGLRISLVRSPFSTLTGSGFTVCSQGAVLGHFAIAVEFSAHGPGNVFNGRVTLRAARG
jgi:hypothetical protein